MKISRLMTYGLIGMITGLIFENKALLFKGKVKDKSTEVKRKAAKLLHRS